METNRTSRLPRHPRVRNIKEELIAERNDLEEKIGRLKKFMKGPTFEGLDKEMQELMMEQLEIMHNYFDALTRRIELL